MVFEYTGVLEFPTWLSRTVYTYNIHKVQHKAGMNV